MVRSRSYDLRKHFSLKEGVIPLCGGDTQHNYSQNCTDFRILPFFFSPGVSAYLDGKYHSLPSELPQDSLFSRRRSSLQGTVPRGSSPKIWRTHKSPLRDDVENQHSQNTPFRSFPSVSPHDRGKEQDSKTLLSILYLQLQQYDLRSALDLIYSLIEPQLSCDDVESIGTFSVFPNTQVENHTSNGNHCMEVLLQNYPIARVADKRGLEIVQTLARFMSAYFSNLSLFVYPPYQPVPLPAFHDHEQELEGPSPVIERVTLDRTKVGQAVRDQNIHELWSANATLELLLVCGLVSEGAWLANNLGDWKNAMLLSFAGGVLASQFSQSATDSVLRFALPVTPKSMTPHAIFWSRLSSLFNLTDVSGGHKTRSVLVDKFLRSTTSKKSPRYDHHFKWHELFWCIHFVWPILVWPAPVGLDGGAVSSPIPLS